jgi:transposase
MSLYVRSLTAEERAGIEHLTRSGDPVTCRRARVVWLSAQQQRVRQVVEATGLSERWVREVIHRFNQRGLASLSRRKATGAAPRCDAGARAALAGLLRRAPAEFGIATARWTGAALAAVAKQQGLPTMSERTVRREIRRAGYRQRQAEGWPEKEAGCERRKGSRTPGREESERSEPGGAVL